jgi:hypothetical protein
MIDKSFLSSIQSSAIYLLSAILYCTDYSTPVAQLLYFLQQPPRPDPVLPHLEHLWTVLPSASITGLILTISVKFQSRVA